MVAYKKQADKRGRSEQIQKKTMATTQSLANLQEVVQKLSDKGMMKEEAFRQISEATVSIFNASQQENPFKDDRLRKEDFMGMTITGAGEFLRHIPTGRFFTADEDGGLDFKGIIMGDNYLPQTATDEESVPAHEKNIVCWVKGQDPSFVEIKELINRIETMEEETQRQKNYLIENNKKMKAQLKAAREGSLLAFQEVEIKDLEDERDRYKKLNEGLIEKMKKQKEEYEEKLGRMNRCQNHLSNDLIDTWERLRENEIPIPTSCPETEKFFRWWRERQDTLPECFRPIPFVWNGAEYLLIEPTNQILDKEDGEFLGERYMCGDCDEIHVKWFSEEDSDGGQISGCESDSDSESE